MVKNNKGITLVALVITIIVLLILAGVSISMLTGNNGVLTKASSANSDTEKEGAVERINTALNAAKIELMGSGSSADVALKTIKDDFSGETADAETAGKYFAREDEETNSIKITYKLEKSSGSVTGSISLTPNANGDYTITKAQ